MPKLAAPFAALAARLRSGRGRPALQKNPLRTFTLWVAIPAALVYVGVTCLLLLALYLMGEEMNAIDASRGRTAVVAAVDSLVVGLGESAADEATWTEAYINTYIEPNPAWLDSTWGATARISDNYDSAILTDKDGVISFGESSRGPLAGKLAEHYSGAPQLLAELDEKLTSLGDDATVAHLAQSGSDVVAVAGAVVHGNTGQAAIPKDERRILWLSHLLDNDMLRETADRFQLPVLRLTEAPAPGEASMSLTDATGAEVATIAWLPPRPGDAAFSHAAGLAAVVMLVIGALVFAVLVAFRRSIKSRAASDARDWHNARFDPVTGLSNGFGLEESLRKAIPRKRTDITVSVAQISLDGFGEIVGLYGREAGDRLLEALAGRIQAIVAGHATLGRTGASEFTLARAGEDGASMIRGVAVRLLGLASETVGVGDLKLKIGLSIGLADASCSRDTLPVVLRMAETAMARARETGGNHLVEYDPAIEDDRRRRRELQADIRRGLEADEFDLDYQPIVDFSTGAIVGVEALMRWNRRAAGPMGPSEFIPAAEASGLIDDLGMFALRRAAEEIGPLEALKLSVNVSAAQLRNPLLAQSIIAVLEDWQVAPGRLQLEVTESFLVAHPERAKRLIEELRSHGIVIALDDFGTGYSSIGYLRQFEFDRVKLDRSMVADIDHDPVQSALVESTMMYAFAMGLAVTAEGVERREEAAILSRLGCREFQGFLFARPMPLDRLLQLLEDDSQRQAS